MAALNRYAVAAALPLCSTALWGTGTAVDDPFHPIPNVLFQGKNSASPNAWPGGELVPGDRNWAWLHDNKIVSACSYVCVCPTGAVPQWEGMLGWGGKPWLKATTSLYVWLWCLRGMHKQPKNDKHPLEVKFGVCEIKPWCRWGPSCLLHPLVGTRAKDDNSLPGVKGGTGLSLAEDYAGSLGVADLVPGAGEEQVPA